MFRMGLEQFEAAKSGEGPGARRLEFGSDRRGLFEQLERPVAKRGPWGMHGCHAERPDGPAVAVLPSAFLQPAAVKAHEIAKPALRRVPAMLDKCRIDARELRSPALVAASDHRHQRPGIVVDTIAMIAVGDRIDRMLDDADTIAQALDGIERKCGKPGLYALAGDQSWPRRKVGKRLRDHARPQHGPAAAVCVLSEFAALVFMVKQVERGFRKGLAVRCRHQHAVAVSEDFPGM